MGIFFSINSYFSVRANGRKAIILKVVSKKHFFVLFFSQEVKILHEEHFIYFWIRQPIFLAGVDSDWCRDNIKLVVWRETLAINSLKKKEIKVTQLKLD